LSRGFHRIVPFLPIFGDGCITISSDLLLGMNTRF
jgi:hypothetical protein